MIRFFRNLFASGDGLPHHKAPAQESPPQRPRAEIRHELFRVGDSIAGEYQIQRKIGEGGFGVVYFVHSCFDQALAIDPRDAEAWCNKGLALAALGRFAEAINALTALPTKSNPNNH